MNKGYSEISAFFLLELAFISRTSGDGCNCSACWSQQKTSTEVVCPKPCLLQQTEQGINLLLQDSGLKLGNKKKLQYFHPPFQGCLFYFPPCLLKDITAPHMIILQALPVGDCHSVISGELPVTPGQFSSRWGKSWVLKTTGCLHTQWKSTRRDGNFSCWLPVLKVMSLFSS